MKKLEYLYEARILEWKDGDTLVADVDVGFNFEFKNQIYRIGRPSVPIDTPEIRYSKKEYNTVDEKDLKLVEQFSDFVIRTVKELVPIFNGANNSSNQAGHTHLVETFYLKNDNNILKDSFGRYLLDVWVGTHKYPTKLTELLIERELAIIWTPSLTKMNKFQRHLANAKKQLGMNQ